MKSHTLLMLFAIILFAFIDTHGQKRFQKSCSEKESVRLTNGETFFNNCEEAYVLNPAAAREMLGTIEKFQALTDSLEKQKGILNDIISNQNKVIQNYASIKAIQDSSYNYLKSLQGGTSNLVKESVQNTEHALSYIKKVKLASYLTSSLVGGVAGGLIDNKNSSFGLSGAIIGTIGGITINYFIQELF